MPKLEIPWQALIDTAPDGVCVLDAEGKVQYANAAALSLLGLRSPDCEGAAEWLIDLSETNRAAMLKTIEDGERIRLFLLDAEHKHLIFEAQPLPGTPGTIIRVRRDHEVDASDTIAIMVHELRLPMTSILGYAKMLLTIGAESLSDMQRQFLNTINRNVERLDGDLQAVHDMTRIDRGRVSFSPTSQSPFAIAAKALEELQSLVEERKQNVLVVFPDDLPHVIADHECTKQILHILLDNALKYTPPGSQIDLQARVVEEMIQFDITDNGLGIPDAEQGMIFTKFFRGEDQVIREHFGLGLNLYIARGLAELQGGQLWYESTPGQGSTFSFTLPLQEESRGQ